MEKRFDVDLVSQNNPTLSQHFLCVSLGSILCKFWLVLQLLKCWTRDNLKVPFSRLCGLTDTALFNRSNAGAYFSNSLFCYWTHVPAHLVTYQTGLAFAYSLFHLCQTLAVISSIDRSGGDHYTSSVHKAPLSPAAGTLPQQKEKKVKDGLH